MGRIMIDGDDYTGSYLGSYPDARDQRFNTKNSINITTRTVQGAITNLDNVIGDMKLIGDLGDTLVAAIMNLRNNERNIRAAIDNVRGSLVFDTFSDMENWLKDSDNMEKATIGTNILIRELNVPDYWISEVLTSRDTDTKYYYKIDKLETGVVNLTSYDNKIGNVDISSIGSSLTDAVKNINDERAQLFQSVSNGKTLVANAITDMGVSTETNATFATMIDNIKNIQTNQLSQSKSIKLDTKNSSVDIIPDDGYSMLDKVTLSIEPQSKTIDIKYGNTAITPDDGKILSKVTINGPDDMSGMKLNSDVVRRANENILIHIPSNGYYTTGSTISVNKSLLGTDVTIDGIKTDDDINLVSLNDGDDTTKDTLYNILKDIIPGLTPSSKFYIEA